MFKANEMFGAMLATEHNLHYFYDLMVKVRAAIEEDRFISFKDDYLRRFYKDDGHNRGL